MRGGWALPSLPRKAEPYRAALRAGLAPLPPALAGGSLEGCRTRHPSFKKEGPQEEEGARP